MALTRTEHTVSLNGVFGNSWTTGTSYTFPSGHPVVVIGIFMNNGGSESPANLFTLTNSGADLGWTKQVTAGNAATDFAVALCAWTTTGDGVARTLTVTKSGQEVRTWMLWPLSYDGAHASSFVGAVIGGELGVSDGAGSLTLPGAPASASEVIAAISAPSNGGDVNVDVGSGWTERYDTPETGEQSRQVQVRTGSTSTTVAWADVANGGSGNYHNPAGIAIEIIAADAGGGAVARQNLLLLGVG